MSQVNAGNLPKNEVQTEFDNLLNGFQSLKLQNAEMSKKLDMMLNLNDRDVSTEISATQERLKAQNLASQQEFTENYEEILKKQEGIKQNIEVSQSFRNTMVENLCSLDNFEKAKLYDKLDYSEKAASALMRKILSLKKEMSKMGKAFVETKTELEQQTLGFVQSIKNSQKQISELDVKINEKSQTLNKLKEVEAFKIKEVEKIENLRSENTEMEAEIVRKVSEIESEADIVIELNSEILATHTDVENLQQSCQDLADLIIDAETKAKSLNERLRDSTYLKDLIQNSNTDDLYSDDCFRRVVMEKNYFKEQKKKIDELSNDTTDLFIDLKKASSSHAEEEAKLELAKAALSAETEIERKLSSELAEVEKQKLELEEKTRIENQRLEEEAKKEMKVLKDKLSNAQKETSKLENKSKREAKTRELKFKSVEAKLALAVQEQLSRSFASKSSSNSKGAPKSVSTPKQQIQGPSAGSPTVLNSKEKLKLAAESKNAKAITPTGKRSIHEMLMTPHKLKIDVNKQTRQITISPIPKASGMQVQPQNVGRIDKMPEIRPLPEISQKEDHFGDDESTFNLSFNTDLADYSDKED